MPKHHSAGLDAATRTSVSSTALALSTDESSVSDTTAQQLVSQLSKGGKRALARALGVKEGQMESISAFEMMDLDGDGTVTKKEYDQFVLERAKSQSMPLTFTQKAQVVMRGAVEMFGFGFTDNTIMLTCGAAIERALGPTFGITGFAAAACGNLISDSCGVVSTTTINNVTAPFLPDIGLSETQERFTSTQALAQAGQIGGVMVGGVCGCWPLLAKRVSNRWKGAASVSAAANPAISRAARMKDMRLAVGAAVLFAVVEMHRMEKRRDDLRKANDTKA